MTFKIQEGDRQVGMLCGRCDKPFKVGDETRLVPCQSTGGGIAACVEAHVVCPSEERIVAESVQPHLAAAVVSIKKVLAGLEMHEREEVMREVFREYCPWCGGRNKWKATEKRFETCYCTADE